ncbi:hypothetical protein K440DRAFT_553948 [Wilcoxina mikolae CBS 423.85]|nr:hypothetical protein K440DRAFT_553948 [Wilcoxina mikolae CBS 423.85]
MINIYRVSLQEQAIANARSAVSRLPPDFQACINQAQTIPEVVEATAQKYHIFKRKRLTRILEKFHQYTLWLQSISAAVDIVVQINTGIGCPLWAPIKFVLIVSNDHARAAEEILNMIRTIKEDLPRFQIYEQLKSDPILDVALLNIFTDVVDFSVQVYQYFGRRALS